MAEVKKEGKEERRLRQIHKEIEELEEAGIHGPFVCEHCEGDYPHLLISPDEAIILAQKIIEFRKQKK